MLVVCGLGSPLAWGSGVLVSGSLTVCVLHCAFFYFMWIFANIFVYCFYYVYYASMGNIMFGRGLLLLFFLQVVCCVGWVVRVGASGVVVWVCVQFCCV